LSFLNLRVNPVTKLRFSTSNAYVDNGIIQGGTNDQESLILSD